MLGTPGLIAAGALFGIALALALTHLFRPKPTPLTPALIATALAVLCGALSLPSRAGLTFLVLAVCVLGAGTLAFKLTAPNARRKE